jgi:Cof subfamily protein (haloacid dehalogenase superfamily)
VSTYSPEPPLLIRLIALDVDGTLLDSRHELRAAVREALEGAARRGVEIVLASARGPSGLKALLRTLGLEGHCVCFSGAMLCRTHPDRPAIQVDGERMELEAARRVVRSARELGVSLGWWEGEDWYVDAVDGVIAREARIIGVSPGTCDLMELGTAPFKLQCMTGPESIDRLVSLQSELPEGLAGHFSNPDYLEVLRAGVDKARGLERLGALLGLRPSSMAAIGDGENDLGMLAVAGLGVAVANARPSVLAAADWITASNDEDGVAAAVARMDREGLLPGPRGAAP